MISNAASLQPNNNLQFHEMIESWAAALKDRTTMVMGEYSAVFPARTPASLSMPGEFVAITGDGLLGVLIKVHSKVGSGTFELVPYDNNEELAAIMGAGKAEFGKIVSGEDMLASIVRMRQQVFENFCERNPTWRNTVRDFLARAAAPNN